ncbi:MAG: hypothetical protein N3A69_09820 [Leptospiraceae bacterium]|nr:hypothetical protein [Leptospiraceae bacterium]
MIGWLLFFLLFGRESFEVGTLKIKSINLFQAQNPILSCLFFFLLFIPKRITTIIIFSGILIFQLSYYYYDKVRLEKQLPESFIYYRYSAPEFFLSGSFIIFETERGIYEFLNKENVSEPIYKFTMKPLRYLNIYERLFVQRLVEEFEFPIVLRENDNIVVYEMFKSYKGNLFRVEIDRFTLEGKVMGPKF